MKSIVFLSCCLMLFCSTASYGEARKRALLVGVTRYPTLGLERQLRGPINDVRLLRDVLVSQFRFRDEDIVMLTETRPVEAGKAEPIASPDLLPTRANIVAQIQRLIADAAPGDVVVILFAGHGSQQPKTNPDQDDEPDGLDETFLPRDTGRWDGNSATVRSAILDDEIGQWTDELRNKGAHVLLIADCCHSGTLLRGTEVSRWMDPVALGVPVGSLPASRGGNSLAPDPIVRRSVSRTGSGTVTAIYATMPKETEPEDLLPLGSSSASVSIPTKYKRRQHGYLTYHICQTLARSSRSLTYGELINSLHDSYRAMGRMQPTPWVETEAAERQVLSGVSWEGVGRISFQSTTMPWTLTAGALHGLGVGDVLAVFPPEADQPIGHVRVVSVTTFDAEVEPAMFQNTPALTAIPRGARCRIVEKQIGDAHLRIGLALLDGHNQAISMDRRARIVAMLQAAEKQQPSMMRFAASPDDADWLIEATGDGTLRLWNRAGYDLAERTRGDQRATPSARQFRFPLDAQTPSRIATVARRIARQRNLLRLAELDQPGLVREGELQVVLELLTRPKGAQEFTARSIGGDLVLHVGDELRWRIKNQEDTPVGVTLLYLDEDYGITAWYPHKVFQDNVVAARGAIETIAARAQPCFRPEHVILIAEELKPQHQPPNYAWLAQPSADAASRTRGGPLRTVFESLLEKQFYGESGAHTATRSLSFQAPKSEPRLRRISWRVAGE
jgi:hypothetical protein